MKPKYRITYNFPNENVKNQYCDDYVDNLYSNLAIYKKYGKFRILEKWEDFEPKFVERLHHIASEHPEIAKTTHLVLYDDIFIGTIKLGDCKEENLLEYARNNTGNWKYIEDMDINKINVVKFDYEYKCEITYKTEYTTI